MQYIKDLLKRWNQIGIHLPMISDPKTGIGSVSLTLLVLSSIWVQISLVGKLVSYAGGMDSESAIYWFLSCAALYFGRNISGNKSNASLSGPIQPTTIEKTTVNINNNVDNPD